MAEPYYAFMKTKQPTNLDKGIIQIDYNTTDRGQKITTRLRTKEIPIMITNRIPKAKTNNNNNNRKQLQQLQTKYNSKIKLKTENKYKKKQRIHNNNRKTLQLENIKLNQQHNTRLTKNHHQKPLITTRKFKTQHQLKRTSAAQPHLNNKNNLTLQQYWKNK